MSSINIYPDSIRAKAQQLENLRKADLETLKQIRIIVMHLGEHWKGTAYTAYMNKYLEQQNSLNEFHKMLEEYIALLNIAAQEAEAMDQKLTGAISNMLSHI